MYREKFSKDKFLHSNISAIVVPARGTNSLGFIRSLGQKGIPIISLDYSRLTSNFYSKYCKGVLCPNPLRDEKKFVNFLLEIGSKMNKKSVLFMMDDYYMFLLTKYQKELSEYFYSNYLSWEVLLSCVDKYRMYNKAIDAGLYIPETYYPKTIEEVKKIAKKIEFPAIIKPIAKFEYENQNINREYQFVKTYRTKALRAKNKDELIFLFKDVKKYNFTTIIQEEIPGTIDQIYTIAAYSDKNHKILTSLTARKIHQLPSDFGTGTLFESIYLQEIVELSSLLIKKIKFYGISEIEFKLDSRDKKFKLIEINCRASNYIYLTTFTGIDLPYIAYRDLIGDKFSIKNQVDGIKWWDIPRDTIYFLRYRNGDHMGNRLPLRKWFSHHKGKKTYAYFDIRDPLPFLLLPIQISRIRDRF
ncbi:MAG: ATP-grasp domain-containing protein [Actinobacteria bacterium]|nr:ATP-grasp domain-containing protein [Actinomycetota bacterium]